MIEWMKEYYEELMNGNQGNAHKIIQSNIPNKLYRYRNIKDYELESIKNNQLWVSHPDKLNDPFDCNAVFFNEEILIEDLSKRKLTISPQEAINVAHNGLRENMKVACFSESPFNMPLWAHYADNHKGMCIEYDLKSFDFKSDSAKGLYPVLYESKRYDITNLLRLAFQGEYDRKLSILFFLLLFKHKSWEYEQEWRILALESEWFSPKTSGKLIDFLKPTVVYMGINSSSEDKIKVRTIIDKETAYIELKMQNSEFFHLDHK